MLIVKQIMKSNALIIFQEKDNNSKISISETNQNIQPRSKINPKKKKTKKKNHQPIRQLNLPEFETNTKRHTHLRNNKTKSKEQGNTNPHSNKPIKNSPNSKNPPTIPITKNETKNYL